MTTCLTHTLSHSAQLQPKHGSALQKLGRAQQHLHEQAQESTAISQAHSVATASDQLYQLQPTAVHIQAPQTKQCAHSPAADASLSNPS